jgi:NTE family protein
MSKNVTLVLSGGGARGFAHIGVIEEIESRGYIINSIAGTSMGALVGVFMLWGNLRNLRNGSVPWINRRYSDYSILR